MRSAGAMAQANGIADGPEKIEKFFNKKNHKFNFLNKPFLFKKIFRVNLI